MMGVRRIVAWHRHHPFKPYSVEVVVASLGCPPSSALPFLLATPFSQSVEKKESSVWMQYEGERLYEGTC